MTKTLKCKLESPILVKAVSPDLDIVESVFTFQPILVDEIADFVSQQSREQVDGFLDLELDILKNGMNNPIIIAANTEEAYQHGAINVHPEFLSPYDKSKRYICIFGNQRLAIAKRNHYDRIYSAMVPSPFWAITLQNHIT